MASTMTPSLLIAPPSLTEQPFNESVIILAGHQKDGSLGFILNRPIGITIKDLMDEGEDHDPFHTEKPVFFGGPVEKNSGFIIYEHARSKPLAPGFMLTKNLIYFTCPKIIRRSGIRSFAWTF